MRRSRSAISFLAAASRRRSCWSTLRTDAGSVSGSGNTSSLRAFPQVVGANDTIWQVVSATGEETSRSQHRFHKVVFRSEIAWIPHKHEVAYRGYHWGKNDGFSSSFVFLKTTLRLELILKLKHLRFCTKYLCSSWVAIFILQWFENFCLFCHRRQKACEIPGLSSLLGQT